MSLLKMVTAGLLYSLTPAAFALTTILAAPAPPYYSPRSTLTIVFDDHNGNGLFDAEELISFSAPPERVGQGSSSTLYEYTGLLSTPSVAGVVDAGFIVSTYNGFPLPEYCDKTRWCFSVNRTPLGQPTVPNELISTSADSYLYSVSPVSEPTSQLLFLTGLGYLFLKKITTGTSTEIPPN